MPSLDVIEGEPPGTSVSLRVPGEARQGVGVDPLATRAGRLLGCAVPKAEIPFEFHNLPLP